MSTALSRKRPRAIRARTLSPRTLRAAGPRVPASDDRQLVLRLFEPEPVDDRPRTWADCQDGTGPCPYVGCRHHRYLDVSPSGGIKLNFPDLEPWQLEEPCTLRLAAERARTLEEVGQLLNLTRERIRQFEGTVLAKLRAAVDEED